MWNCFVYLRSVTGVQRARKSSGDPITGVQRKNINTNKILITMEVQTQLNFSWLAELTNPHHDGTTQQIYDFAHAYQTDNSGDTPGDNPGTIIDGADEG